MLILYSTEGCHLCEMAQQLIEQARIDGPVRSVDIAFDDSLFSRYGVTIPVLRFQDSELGWPFDFQELLQWLKENGINHHS